jgi:simple sugar transport system substrate-binding protein
MNIKIRKYQTGRWLLLPLFCTLLTAQVRAEESNAFTLSSAIKERIGKETGGPVIRVSYHDVSNEFAPFIKKGVEKAATDFKADVKMVGPVGADAEKQVAEIESLIQKGVDGLAISSVSTDALAPVINRALAQGIPVVTYNTDNPTSKRLAFAGQDLVESGRIAGKLLAETLGGKGNVLITTLDAAAQWSLDREKGAREAFAKYLVLKSSPPSTPVRNRSRSIRRWKMQCSHTPTSMGFYRWNAARHQRPVTTFNETDSLER